MKPFKRWFLHCEKTGNHLGTSRISLKLTCFASQLCFVAAILAKGLYLNVSIVKRLGPRCDPCSGPGKKSFVKCGVSAMYSVTPRNTTRPGRPSGSILKYIPWRMDVVESKDVDKVQVRFFQSQYYHSIVFFFGTLYDLL